ncbi:MAG: hypothetical protein AB7O97_07475 [Planctomycetota bacterium]
MNPRTDDAPAHPTTRPAGNPRLLFGVAVATAVVLALWIALA